MLQILGGRSSYFSLLAATGLADFKMAAVVRKVGGAGSVELGLDGSVDEGEVGVVESGAGSDLGFLLRKGYKPEKVKLVLMLKLKLMLGL